MPTPEQSVLASRSRVDPPAADKVLPPLELQHRVTDALAPDTYLEHGRRSALDLEASLASADRSLDSFERILDFGCGPGRVLLWLEQLGATTDLHGTDIDDRSVGWVRENLPYATAACNPAEPPLDYPDNHFDLVYSHSVFTHIDERYQDLWLAELARVTRPGGLVLASVHGQEAFDRAVIDVRRMNEDPSGWAQTLAEKGILHITNDTYVGGPFPDFYHTTFHLPWYVFAHWGRFFTVRSYLARRSLNHQDFVLLEKPAEGKAPPAPLSQPAASAPVPEPIAAVMTEPSGGPALHRVSELLNRGFDVDAPTQFGTAGRGVRRMVARALRHYTCYQDEVNRALIGAGEEEAERRAGGDRALLEEFRRRDALPNSLNPLAAEILRRQGERINRLEDDIQEALNRSPGGVSGAAADPSSDRD